MNRSRSTVAATLATLLALAVVPGAGAKPHQVKPPAGVVIGKSGIGSSPDGRPSILLPVRYPIQMDGRVATLRFSLLDGRQEVVHSRRLDQRVSSGRSRRPEKRRRFTFVHGVELGGDLIGRLRGGLALRVTATAAIDVDGDGRRELFSSDSALQPLPAGPGGGELCSSLPQLRVKPGKRVAVPLPACADEVEWRVAKRQLRGSARVRDGKLVYRAGGRFRGSELVQLVGKRPRRGAGGSAAAQAVPGYAEVTVGSAGGVVVRALGDSVTAGFGYYSDGTSMTIGQLYECRPAAKEFDDACSSNSLNRTSEGTKVEYAPDYGLANNVSWAAQWANEHGVTNYKNYAISGSEPKDWAPEGEFHKTAERIAAEDPDYVLMTIGANPLLSEMLFGLENMGCAIYADVFGGYRECIEEAFAEISLQARLRSLYSYLVKNTDATIFLMQYHLSVPSAALAYSATQIAEMGKLLNREIEAVAAKVSPSRLRVVAPPHFNVGIDISPVYPSRFSCSLLGYEVDGPSVQSTPTQDELEVLHPLSFCEGPANGGPPWVISGDTGIHPSAAGYAQMASQVPPPG